VGSCSTTRIEQRVSNNSANMASAKYHIGTAWWAYGAGESVSSWQTAASAACARDQQQQAAAGGDGGMARAWRGGGGWQWA